MHIKYDMYMHIIHTCIAWLVEADQFYILYISLQTRLRYHSTSDYIRKLLVKRMMGWRRFLHRGGYRFSRDFRADTVNRWPLKEDIALSHLKPALPQNLQVNLWVGGGECEYCQSILTSVGLEGESLRNSARQGGGISWTIQEEESPGTFWRMEDSGGFRFWCWESFHFTILWCSMLCSEEQLSSSQKLRRRLLRWATLWATTRRVPGHARSHGRPLKHDLTTARLRARRQKVDSLRWH